MGGGGGSHPGPPLFSVQRHMHPIIAPLWAQKIGPSHPLRASSEVIQKLLNRRWMEAQAQWRRLLKSEPCNYCGKLPHTDDVNPHHRLNTVDHIVPQSSRRGQPNHWDNFGAACPSCNSRKGSRSMLWFLRQRQRKLDAVRKITAGRRDAA